MNAFYCTRRSIVSYGKPKVKVFYWATFGWVRWGSFDNVYQAEYFIAKYPQKKWKIISSEYLDNVIEE